MSAALAGGPSVTVGTEESYEVVQLFEAPDDEVNFTYTTCTQAVGCSLLNLPQRGGTRTVAAGVATNAYDDGKPRYHDVTARLDEQADHPAESAARQQAEAVRRARPTPS